MLLDIFFPKSQNKQYQSDAEFIYKYIIKWFLIILIVTIIFFIINNLFYNTLENEINTSIYDNPTSPTDMIKISPSINENISTKILPSINENISTKISPSVNANISTKILPSINANISTKILPLNKKALNIIPNIKYEEDSQLFDNLKDIFDNIKNVKSNNELDFNISL